MNTLDFLAEKADRNTVIDRSLYSEGLFDVVDFLMSDLWMFMREENRFFGIIPYYKNTVTNTFCKFNKNVQEEDLDTFGRILYLFKPLIIRDFKRLRTKRLSKADSIIVIANKILDTLRNSSWFKYKEELAVVSEVVSKLYDNIRHNAKRNDLIQLSSSLKYYSEMGWTGKITIHELHLTEEDLPRTKTILEGSGLRFEDTDESGIGGELIWKEE